MAIRTVGTGGAYATFKDACDAASSGDTIQYVSDVTDTSIETQKTFADLTIDFNGYDVTFTSLPDGDYVYRNDAAVEKSVTITGGGGTVTISNGGLLRFIDGTPSTVTISDITVISSEDSLSSYFTFMTGGSGLVFSATDCDFSTANRADTQALGVYTNNVDATVTLTRCVFTDFYKCVDCASVTADAVLTVDECTFKDYHVAGIVFPGGAAYITDNTFTDTLSASASRYAINYAPTAGETTDSEISGNTITTNSDGISAYLSGDVAQGTGLLISGNTINGDPKYACRVRVNQAVVEHNRFLGSGNINYHGLLIGRDAGTDIGDADRAKDIIVRDNLFIGQAYPAEDGSWNWHFIVLKGTDTFVTRNYFDFLGGPDFEIASPNLTGIYLKGGETTRILYNSILNGSGDIDAIRLGIEGATDVAGGEIHNNKAYGTFKTLIIESSGTPVYTDQNNTLVTDLP